MLPLVYYLPITHSLKNNYMGMTRSDVIKVLLKKNRKVEVYCNSNYRKFYDITEMQNCLDLLERELKSPVHKS